MRACASVLVGCVKDKRVPRASGPFRRSGARVLAALDAQVPATVARGAHA